MHNKNNVGLEKIIFENKPSTASPINATNLNLLQNNVDELCQTIQDDIANDTEIISTTIEELKENNIYSKEEKIVGTWIDRKPLYRKISNVTLENKSSWTNLISIPNLDKIINVYGFVNNITIPRYESSSYYTQFMFENDYLKYMSNGSSGSAFIVTEYTKTTDEVSNE